MWAVLQLALPQLAMFADARLERESEATRATHIESSTRATCRPVHPAECALCQFVSRVATPAQAVACPVVVTAAVRPPAAARIDAATNARSHLPPARGPPLG